MPNARFSTKADPETHLLLALGARIRGLREAQNKNQALLAEESGLSRRFLADVEAGRGNIAITRLARLALALGTTAGHLLIGLLPEASLKRSVIALLGLRGAGKSTIGRAAARELRIGFLEHDRMVEEAAGMELRDLFAFHGDEYYRRLARESLDRFLAKPSDPAILATGGGVVADDTAYDALRSRTVTIWLKADPEDHWKRVLAQGDRRPMSDRPRAEEELRLLLEARKRVYARADHTVDTSALGQKGATRAVIKIAEVALTSSTTTRESG